MRASDGHPGLNINSGEGSNIGRNASSVEPTIQSTVPTVQPTTVAVSSSKDGAVRIELHIPSELCYFEGHFPGCSLLPGVVQINWAVQFGRQNFSLPARFSYLSQVKFMRVITPGSPATLTLEFAAARGELAFTYHVVDALCSSGKIGFV